MYELPLNTMNRNMMKCKLVLFLFVIVLHLHCFAATWQFTYTREAYQKYNRADVVLVASPGRSGSTFLADQLQEKVTPQYLVVKSHLLPPDHSFIGKILFIFSNPDVAAESALKRVLASKAFAIDHVNHVESVDWKWVEKLGGLYNIDIANNILSYDVLGCTLQLTEWLHNKTIPCTKDKATILAIKYEHLWDADTIKAINEFLGLEHFSLSAYRHRVHNFNEDLPLEKEIRLVYNLGTISDPKYKAYDDARSMWENAPPFQYLKIL